MPCFQCPVCKKRFQRHIAMNAHFQNEHIASCGAAGGKLCKLCSKAAPDIMSLRVHLNSAHGINLDNPLASLVEGAPPAPPQALQKPSRRSDDDDSSTSSETVPTSSSSSSTTPDQRMSPVPIKPEPGVMDMTVTSLKRQSPPAGKKRAKSAKRAKRGEEQPSSDTKFRCQFCLIDFPNQTLYFLHRGFHGEAGGDPWRCNGCGERCADMYDFNTHLVSVAHK